MKSALILERGKTYDPISKYFQINFRRFKPFAPGQQPLPLHNKIGNLFQSSNTQSRHYWHLIKKHLVNISIQICLMKTQF